MPRYLDLFAGAGGLSEGFIRAGYEPVAHVEMDVAACYSLKTRVAYHWLKRNEKLNTYNRYLKGEITRNEFYEEIPKSVLDSVLNYEISEETLPVIFAEIDAMLGEKKLDLIVGGPPCQAYSLAGRSRSENKMVGDKRNYLYKLYAEFLKRYQPEYFVFENVVGLLSAKDEDPAEYYLIPCGKCDATVVVGWLKRAIMRKALYGFNTQFYTVLLYDYEKRWKNYDTYKWNAALDSNENRKTIERSFTTEKIKVSTSRFVSKQLSEAETPKADELSEIETVLRENKFRQYVASGGQKAANETTEAIPVNYVGGFLAFYRTGHKVISASSIIEQDADKIEMKLPTELKMGDFIVVRETDHDLVKEIADVILARTGKSGLRDLSSKWKEALTIETLFYSADEIYEKLQKAGCTRGYQAVRSWITDDDMIAPQSKQDLQHIAVVTGSGVLKEKLDQVYEAAQAVKAAHVQAGRVLSLQLRNRVASALKEYGNIDPFNIWDPIEMQVDDVGLVRILKIIDIGTPVIVDIADTNRLIDE